jgi:uncharacterized membrane protein
MEMAGATGKYFYLNFIFLPMLLIQIWFVSVFRIFNFTDNSWVWLLGLTEEVIMLLIRIYFVYLKIDDRQDICSQVMDYLIKR